jgi:predicted SnoaL-like aldol condensation-catalyzing enzyme
MSKYDKKLLLILIALIVILILTLTIKPSKRPSDFVQRYKNKKLVADAILAFNEDPYDANLPKQFDPNYLQYRLGTLKPVVPTPCFYGKPIFSDLQGSTLINSVIMAEDSKVVVFHFQVLPESSQGTDRYTEFAIYRIANGKIVEGWSVPAMISVDVSQ